MNANIENDMAVDETIKAAEAPVFPEFEKTPELVEEGTLQDTEFSDDPAGN